TPGRLIDQVQPDVLVKGGDYLAEEIVGYQTVTTKGGTVKVLPFLEGHSTTNIIKKIKEQG
ncbi:MAG: D-glycero-beta-D-manno-heptose 1-phosphate adenylyltransferase, partial [Deltaproteobacteria bacterium]